jgi:hypothetical protein
VPKSVPEAQRVRPGDWGTVGAHKTTPPDGRGRGGAARDAPRGRRSCRGRERPPVSCSQLLAEEEDYHPVALSCRVLGVSRAGFSAWRGRPPSAWADAALTAAIHRRHRACRGTSGSPRSLADQREEGRRHGRRRVARLMRQAHLAEDRGGVDDRPAAFQEQERDRVPQAQPDALEVDHHVLVPVGLSALHRRRGPRRGAGGVGGAPVTRRIGVFPDAAAGGAPHP